MIRTLFYKTIDSRYVEVNALVATPQRIIERGELPPDIRPCKQQIGAYRANRFAREHDTFCNGEVLCSAYMRNLENKFVNPEFHV